MKFDFMRMKSTILEAKTWLWRKRGIFLRAVICWGIGCAVLLFDELNSHDFRFLLRGSKAPSGDMLIVDIGPRDILSLQKNQDLVAQYFQDAQVDIEETISDPTLWADVIQRLLQLNPKKVGVSYTTNKDLNFFRSSVEQKQSLKSEKVVWGANLDTKGTTFSSLGLASYGFVHLLPDSDFSYRRYQPQREKGEDFIEALSEKKIGGPKLINFMGPSGTFPSISFADLLQHPDRKQLVNGKILIVGSTHSPSDFINTPVGPLSRAEFFANLLEANIGDKWISRLPISLYRLMLLGLLLVCVWLVLKYPQTATFVFFIWIGTSLIALSLWTFDAYYLWIPLVSSIVQMFATFVIFISFQLAVQEKNHWKLTQKTKSFQEIEQLKSNFVSLFSHDLKTPIAKIQAIVDRMLTQELDSGLTQDLKTLRRSSDELHSYIQKILHISKVESRQIKLRKEISDINDIVQRVGQRLRPLAFEKDIELVFDLCPLFSIEVDTTLIEEVVLNLLDNAIKYSPSGSKVTIRTSETVDKVSLTIEDQGPGISKEDQARVWSKFARGKGQEAGMKGSGLGLYLSKYFIELHQGEVSLSSEIGKGTSISFSLPFELEEKDSDQQIYFSPQAFSNDPVKMEWTS